MKHCTIDTFLVFVERLRSRAFGRSPFGAGTHVVIAFVSMLGASLAHAPSAHGQPATDADRASALELLGRGDEAFRRGDIDGALRLFRKSRATNATGRVAFRAAMCLERLARLDEALDMYEEASHSPSELNDNERQAIARALTELGPRAGFVQVSATVRGWLVVDGVARARLPLTSPIHALVGVHRVRVVADGYDSFDEAVAVRVGEVSGIDARLAPLSIAGRLHVEGVPAATVFVDGAPRGPAPWEGAIAPGEHAVWLEGDDTGSAPARAMVRVGEVTTMRPMSVPIGATLRVEVDPESAHLAIDGVDVGAGAWLGRLPLGPHVVRAMEDGYAPQSASVASTAGGAPAPITLRLAIDPASPRWPKPRRTHGDVRIVAHGAYLRGTTFHADAEELCPTACPTNTRPDGGLFGARGAIVLSSGLAFELDVGYATVSNKLTRKVAGYLLYDTVHLRGPYGSLGASWERPIAPQLAVPLGIVTRVAIGGVLADSADDVSGGALIANRLRASTIAHSGESVSSFAPFVAPSLGVTARYNRLYGALTVGALFGISRGPALPTGAITTRALPDSNAIAAERAYGPFFLWVPEIAIGFEL
jgi:hypothetical protein